MMIIVAVGVIMSAHKVKCHVSLIIINIYFVTRFERNYA